MTDLEKILWTSASTIIGGGFVLVAGQIIIRFCIEPIQELKRTIGEVADILIYHANVYMAGPRLVPGSLRDQSPDVNGETQSSFRQAASRLRSKANVVPFYRVFSMIRLVPSRDKISIASGALIGIGNSLDGHFAKENKERRDEIVQALSIWL